MLKADGRAPGDGSFDADHALACTNLRRDPLHTTDTKGSSVRELSEQSGRTTYHGLLRPAHSHSKLGRLPRRFRSDPNL